MTVLSLSIAGLFYICLWTNPQSSQPFFSIQNHPCHQSKTSNLKASELDVALKKASMPNKTLIIAIVNKAYVEGRNGSYPSMLDLFLESFWIGENTRPLLDHLLLVALDQTAYDKCKFRRLNCYKLVTKGVDFNEDARDKFYLTKNFYKMMWRRTEFLIDVLKHGYSFILTDADIMWLRNPFPRLNKNGKDDLQISTDWSPNRLSEKSIYPNTGFYFIRSNKRTIAFFKKWYAMRTMKHNSTRLVTDQNVMTTLIQNGAYREFGVKLRCLDTVYFSGFCERSTNLKVVTTVHANCCPDLSAKIVDAPSILRDWKRYKDSIASKRNETFKWTKHITCEKSWENSWEKSKRD